MSEKKSMKISGAIVKINSMETSMAETVVDIAFKAIKESMDEKGIASYIKAGVEEALGGTWHCFAGRNFGTYVTHEEGKFIYFYIGQMGICVFG
jgi:dynein light chain LC8-type